MPVKEWTPERRATAEKAVRFLRKDGYTYEDIVHHTTTIDGEQMEPWEVYELANPVKTAVQVKAWKARHYPDA